MIYFFILIGAIMIEQTTSKVKQFIYKISIIPILFANHYIDNTKAKKTIFLIS